MGWVTVGGYGRKGRWEQRRRWDGSCGAFVVEKRVGRGSCGVVTMSSTAVVERALSSCGWNGQLVEREWRTGGEVDMCLQLWWLHKHNWWRGSGGLGFPTAPWGNK